MSSAKEFRSANAKRPDGYAVTGRAKDGVWIIKPSLKPTHFSRTEAASSVVKILRQSQSGRVFGAAGKKSP
jgi:hypothetical protein